MRLSGSVDQPTEPQRRCSKSYKKATTVAVGLEPSVAELQEHLAALTRELSEAREQQTATANILKVISQSTFQLQPVFDAIIQTARRLCDAEWAALHTLREGKYSLVAADNATQAMIKHASEHPVPPGRSSLIGRTAIDGDTVHIPDCLVDPEYTRLDYQAVGGYRSMLGVPLLRQGVVIGVIALVRNAVAPFTDRQIGLVKTFADQAVIAIENVRLFEAEQERTREATESLQQQTATADVLKVISQSTFDLQKVLDALVGSAASLCHADKTMVYRREGDNYHLAASYGFADEFRQYAISHPHVTGRGTAVGRMSLEGRTIHIPDVSSDPEYTFRQGQSLGNFRTVLAVPMLRQGTPIGALVLIRAEPRPFNDKQVELVTTFADQAVIAIENTRLLNELSESLQQQTATADVLKVISRSTFDLQAVLNALTESATRLCGATRGHIFQFDGEVLRFAAAYGAWPGFTDYLESHPVRPGRGSVSGRAAAERKTCHVHDVLNESDYEYGDLVKQQGYRTVLAVPMLREGELLGVITIVKAQVEPFTDKQIEIVSTFADQAAIAIENTRLLNELREALRQQTATADVLKIISQSTFRLQPVFDAIAQTASRLCNAEFAVFYMFREGKLHLVASNNASDAVIKYASEHPIPPGRESLVGRTFLDGSTVQIPDCLGDPEYALLEYQAIGRYRSMLGVPLLREGTPIGVIGLLRTVVMPFTDKQIDLVNTFAD